jgi:hypothetical protein
MDLCVCWLVSTWEETAVLLWGGRTESILMYVDCGAVDGMRIGKEKQKYSEKTYPSAALSSNPTWPGLRSNPGLRSGKPATNRHGHHACVTGVAIQTGC